ncbi:Ldh family oxidoreductase [Pragia fontium]|uniref:Malate/lactate/ureidoglycolate dehydrogenase, LDH2 family n=1 Tax=Pragia fontium DSM 5563 = ATCC 49100 TaxID=1122977 RepID=A0AAJ5BIP6_9GAMM|nr:Ldh family oxidoreductase [Pragia fontium]SFD45209.1 Malate/lactate/ureidoglycolate dehydrogenase, LDH2 family [Pragia fontium DSM 5563 = ATCC 49100]
MEEKLHLTIDEVHQLAKEALLANGFSEQHAQAIAENVTSGERDGCASHGLYRVLVCVNSLRSGKVSADALPIITTPAPAIVKADAQGGYSLLSHRLALPVLIEQTRKTGIGALAINHCLHFSALWMDIEPLTEAGMVAFAFTPSHAWVAPAGGNRPVFGTNPIAFGWPRKDRSPFIFDLATSMVARGEIELYRRAGKPIPEGWGIDAEGKSTTDAQAVLDGAMLTFGGHKGSALSAMVELIAGPLIGDMTSADSIEFDKGTGSSPRGGELIIAIDPDRFLGDDREQHFSRAEKMFTAIESQGARLPSQRRYQARMRALEEGLDISKKLYDEIKALSYSG